MNLSLPYVPFEKQIEAHTAPEEITLYAGGYGAGKTWWAVAEALRNTARMPGVDGVVCSPTYPIQRKTIYKTIVDVLPGATRWPRGRDKPSACLGPLVKDWIAQDRVLVMWNGVCWFLGSLDDPGSIEGGTYGWGVLDEPRLVTHEGWRVFNSRVRDPRSPWLRRSVAGVPAMGWMADEFDRGLAGRRVVRASSLDNPHLPPGYVDQLNLSGRRAQAFIHGHFVHMEGSVFETYVPHPSPGEVGSIVEVTPDPERKTWGFADFGRRRPYFGIAQEVEGLATDGGTALVVVEELPGVDVLERAHARQCAALCARYGLTLLDVWCDPAGNTANAQTGMSTIQVYEDEFARLGVLGGRFQWTMNPVDRHIPNGVDVVRARLEDIRGERHLFISSQLTDPVRCARYGEGIVGVHNALLGYRYPANRPGNDLPAKDGQNDHAMDALRYLIVGLHGVVEAPDIGAMNQGIPSRAGAGYSGLDLSEDW